MKKVVAVCLSVIGVSVFSHAQEMPLQIQEPPSFKAGISIGFNYDLLRAPTDVSFEYPQGFIGLNIPFSYDVMGLSVLKESIDELARDSTIFAAGTELQPEVSARQNANTTVRVDVPMIGGVATFANTQNFYLNYVNTLGNPDLLIASDDTSETMFSYLIRGTVNVPLELTIGWETITFGYAYRVNKNLVFALNLHRHLFTFDLAANINIDILGNYEISLGGEEGMGAATIPGQIDYPSRKLRGTARGVYQAEVWSPTIGIDLWRFTWTSRFGINTRARGSLYAQYSLPFFMDPVTFDINFPSEDNLPDAQFIGKLQDNASDSLRFATDNDMQWKMPQGHTIQFDIVRDKLTLSYTKFFGEISMALGGISKTIFSKADEPESFEESFDLGCSVDHIILLSGTLPRLFFNLGIFAFDFRANEREHLLGNVLNENLSWMTMGDAAMIPVLNLGSVVGSKMQLLLELDILPLPAVKTGIFYNF